MVGKQQVFIVKQQVLVFIMTYMFGNKWMPKPTWDVYGNVPKEWFKCHENPMNSILESDYHIFIPEPKVSLDNV